MTSLQKFRVPIAQRLPRARSNAPLVATDSGGPDGFDF